MSLPIALITAQQGATRRNKEKGEICHIECKAIFYNDLQNDRRLALAMLLRGLSDATLAQNSALYSHLI